MRQASIVCVCEFPRMTLKAPVSSHCGHRRGIVHCSSCLGVSSCPTIVLLLVCAMAALSGEGQPEGERLAQSPGSSRPDHHMEGAGRAHVLTPSMEAFWIVVRTLQQFIESDDVIYAVVLYPQLLLHSGWAAMRNVSRQAAARLQLTSIAEHAILGLWEPPGNAMERILHAAARVNHLPVLGPLRSGRTSDAGTATELRAALADCCTLTLAMGGDAAAAVVFRTGAVACIVARAGTVRHRIGERWSLFRRPWMAV